jgi:hypothetical protein
MANEKGRGLCDLLALRQRRVEATFYQSSAASVVCITPLVGRESGAPIEFVDELLIAATDAR